MKSNIINMKIYIIIINKGFNIYSNKMLNIWQILLIKTNNLKLWCVDPNKLEHKYKQLLKID